MKLIVATGMVCVSAIFCVWLVLQETRTQFVPPPLTALATPTPRVPASKSYEFHADGGHIFLVDQTNGWVWRYFINRDDKGKINGEGFAQMGFLPMGETPLATATPAPTP